MLMSTLRRARRAAEDDTPMRYGHIAKPTFIRAADGYWARHHSDIEKRVSTISIRLSMSRGQPFISRFDIEPLNAAARQAIMILV